jgi:glycine/serine hydroxymethyltransferase
MDQEASKRIAGFICDILDDESNIEAVAKKVKDLCTDYPVYIGK